MITRIELFNPFRTSTPDLTLSGSSAHEDPVQILNIEGLDPVTSEISSTPFATGRGELYQGASTGKRNLVLTLGLNPDWEEQTVASLRKLLYAYLMPELWVRLRFFTDDYPPVQITGIVESFAPNIFSQDPEIQVSILCPKPDFVAVDATYVNGTIADDAEHVIDYTGTVTTGFELRIKATDAVPSLEGDLTIVNESVRDIQVFQALSIPVDTSKYFMISTVKSSRRIQSVFVESGAVVNLLARMVVSSNWPELSPGENVFSIAAEAPGQEWVMGYFNRYGGL